LPATSNKAATAFSKRSQSAKPRSPRKRAAGIAFAAGSGGFSNGKTAQAVHRERDQVLLDSWAQPHFSASVTFSGSQAGGTGVAQNLTTGALVAPPLVISPLTMDSGRLATLCSLYQEWMPVSVRLKYKPTVGEFNNGSLIFAYSKDPTWTPFNTGAVTSTSYNPAASLKLLSEQAGARSAHIAKDLTFTLIRPGDFKGDQWLLCSPTNVSGVVSRLTTAGIAWCAIEGLPTGSDGVTALTSQPGYFTLEYDIMFRGATDNALARSIAETVNTLALTSLTGVTAGSALQFEVVSGPTHSILVGPEIAVCYLENDLLTVTGSGTASKLGANQPIFLGRIGTQAYYNAYTTLYDAITQSANGIVAAVTTTANIYANISTWIPLNPQAAG
jgi:hypothetical protein